MATLKDRLNHDLTEAMKARDTTTVATIRMTLTALSTAERSGDTVRELGDDEVLTVVRSEAKKRVESAEVYRSAGRPELADKETAELAVLERYLPAAATADEIDVAVRDTIDRLGVSDMKGMGAVVKAVREQLEGRADGGAVSAAVKKALSGS